MSKQIEKLKKLFADTLHNGIFLNEGLTARDVVDTCEEKGKFFSHNKIFIAPIRSSYQKFDCIRMIFVIKETESGKVQDVERVMSLIKDLETAIVCIDNCEQTKSDGFIYVDIIKKLIFED